jgi:hypothetical protein
MQCWPLLQAYDPQLDDRRTKIHFAVRNQNQEDPLDEYRSGDFPHWQSWQSRANFELDHVVALIQLPDLHQWLFAGAYDCRGRRPEGQGYRYDMIERPGCAGLNGRLIVRFEKDFRASYPCAWKLKERLLVTEVRATRRITPAFEGFKGLHLTKAQLDLIVRENDAAWRSALSSVAGVYLISDTRTGKFYVGSAYGQGGFWNRWCTYSATCHGHNRELKKLLGVDPTKGAETLQYSVLEIADTHASKEEILERETHWKEVLLTRDFGFNAN